MRFKDFLANINEEEKPKQLASDSEKPVDPNLSQKNRLINAAKSARLGREEANKGKKIDTKA
jgi:hypothetical protein